MRAAERDQSRKRPHPAVMAALFAALGLVLALFAVALHANAMALIDGYRATNGQAGVPGTVTVERAVDVKQGRACTGTFVPDDGGPAVEVRIELPGRCEVGQEAEAHLIEGRTSLFRGYDEPRAWAAGAKTWAAYIPPVILFGLLNLPALLVVVILLNTLLKRLLRPSEGPAV
ncbi:hypothetical protein K3N28_02535 [Glycomyces sp. TRM65418]|uniref:hypothetical protein n=1 Tax=Glycomyces sp. TRM65418 TaxID=2867006 RepID=UPI001CE6F8AF|nr:hypothetical protein [Glycomyces sp. TRM65418]MCC3761947.1 hypothetical protein [Glycomyces sp. TRM65418]QZD56026.1 hypothetical protein K3N28_02525 [Glycomyces sp. TRM65418]